MRMTEAEFADYQTKRGAVKPKTLQPANNLPVMVKKTPASNTLVLLSPLSPAEGQILSTAKGRIRVEGMNKTETRYCNHLEGLKRIGQVLWYRFEGVKLRLAKNTTYSPDFFVMLSDGSLECHEVKGHWEDDARVKIKVAAEMFPFRFIAAQPAATGWKIEVF